MGWSVPVWGQGTALWKEGNRICRGPEEGPCMKDVKESQVARAERERDE